MAENVLATYAIKVDGKSPEDTLQVAQLHIALHFDQECIASLMIVADSEDSKQIQLPGMFQANARIEISLGYNGTHSRVFAGELSAIELKINQKSEAVFYVSAISDTEFTGDGATVLSLTYGDTLYALDGVAHLDEPITNHHYPTEIELQTQGTSMVFPEDMIQIDGCSQWFDGEYRVKTVVHSVQNGDWLTQLVVSN